MVEFAIIAMVLLFFFLGTIDFARFMYYSDAISSAARVGAEVATNHCAYENYGCGTVSTGKTYVTDNYVMWATYCEAQTSVNLNLGQYPVGAANTTSVSTSAYANNGSQKTLGPCIPDDTSSNWAPTCANGASCTTACTHDICVAPTTRSSSGLVSVSVGYDFEPITPLMNQFFPTRQCWHTSDSPAPSQDDPTSNNHTLCARAVGRVF
jgi:Flp pilus assembly protein TadG